jgi:hypothetical protein
LRVRDDCEGGGGNPARLPFILAQESGSRLAFAAFHAGC